MNQNVPSNGANALRVEVKLSDLDDNKRQDSFSGIEPHHAINEQTHQLTILCRHLMAFAFTVS